MGIVRGVISLIFCSMLSSLAYTQLLPRTVHFAKNQYGAHNQNWMIAQAPDHKMYFGNTEGLLEFDGINWNLFQLPDKQAVRSVVCDDQGHIFTGGFGAFGFWKRDESGTLQYHSLVDSLIRPEVEKEEIWHILKGDQFVLFQSFSSIFIYDYQKVTPLHPPGNIMYAHLVNGQLLIQGIDSGLYSFSKEGKFELLPATLSLSDKKVTSILPFKEDGCLVATENAGVFLFVDNVLKPWPNNAQKAFENSQINKGIFLSDNTFVFGTIMDGLYTLNDAGEILYHVNQESSLQNNTVLALFEDDRQNLWCGLDKGIDLIELNTPVKYFTDKTGEEGTVYAACIYEDNLYLGTNQGLFVKKWAELNDFSSRNGFEIVEGSQGQVWELKIFDGQLLCGHNEGTFVVKGRHFHRISPITGGFITVNHPANPDILIQGTYTGLVVFQRGDHGRWRYSHRVEGFLEPVKQLVFSQDTVVWVASPTQGLYRLVLSANLDEILSRESFGEKNGLKSNFNIDITKNANQVLFKSEDRYYAYDEERRSFLPAEDILMQGTNFKFRRFNEQAYFRIFKNRVQCNIEDEIQLLNLSLVPGYETILELRPGIFLFCLDDGFAILDKHKPTGTGPFPGPSIDLVETFGKRQNIRLSRPFASSIILPANQNDLRIHFFQPIFEHEPQLSYQLEGYDTIWYDTDVGGIKEFTNLPAGNYTFRIRNQEFGLTDALNFSIRQVWYKRPWMVLVYLGAAGFAAFVFYQMHLRRLERERRILEAERARALREQEIRSRNEMLSLEVVSKSKELANSTMGLIRKNETLQHVKNELMRIRKAKHNRFEGKDFQKILHLIDVHITSEQDWEIFETNFNRVHEHFFKKLKEEFPDLTPGDLKLAAYLKMNLSSKEIAPLLNISIRGVENKRYRLRRKIGLPAPKNLTEFMIGY